MKTTNNMNSKNHATVRALVLTGFGINCEHETAAAYKLAGAEADIVHINEVFACKISIHDYDILNFPGGFSFGDDLGSGKVLANKIRYKRQADGKSFFGELKNYISRGNFILGICNGFQALVKSGLLPNIRGRFEQEVTLAANDSGKFEDRWCRLVKNSDAKTPFLNGIEEISLPVRHGEGKLVISDPEIRREIIAKSLVCLSYCGFDGKPTSEYPFNPNGSELHAAALTDTTGRIMGIMPHPEAFTSFYNHPDWVKMKMANPGISENGRGLKLFENIIEYVRENAKTKGEAQSDSN